MSNAGPTYELSTGIILNNAVQPVKDRNDVTKGRVSLSKNIKILVLNAIRNSTAHGAAQLLAATTFWIRLFWIVCLLASWIFFVIQIRNLCVTFLSQPTTTTMSPNGALFEVPDVILCNPIPMSSSYSKAMLGPPFRPDALQVLNALQQVINVTANIVEDNNTDNFIGLLSSTATQTIPHGVFSRTAGHPVHQMVINIAMNGIPVSYTNFELLLHHEYLNCFKIRPDSTLFQAPFGKITMYLYTDAHSEASIESQKDKDIPVSLLTLNGDVVYDKSTSILIYFVPRDFYPEDGSTYIHASAGQFTDVKLKMNKYKLANRHSAPCLESPPVNKLYNDYTESSVSFAYKREQCIFNKIIDYFVNEAHCYPAFVAKQFRYKDVPYCYNTSRVIMGQESITQLLERLQLYKQSMAMLPWQLENIARKCEGQQRCTHVSYDVRTTIAGWPIPTLYSFVLERLRNAKAERVAKNLTVPGWDTLLKAEKDSALLNTYIKQNLAKVEIAPAESTSAYTQEVFSYKPSNFISDIGGQMGLLLGISVLSFVEVISCALEILNMWCRTRRLQY